VPQFEVELDRPALFRGLVRGLDIEDAVRRAAGMPRDAELAISPDHEIDGWRTVRLAGADIGRARAFQRMRFRRD